MSKTILIIEDDQDIQNYYEMILSDLNVKVIRAMDGRQAFKIIDSGKQIDLLILDVLMPVMDGEEFLWKLRSGRKNNTPVIASTIDKNLVETLKAVGDIQAVYIKGEKGEVLKNYAKKLLEI